MDVESKPLHKCPKCDRTFANIGHMKCHFYRVHPEFKLAEFELPVQTPKPPEQQKQLLQLPAAAAPPVPLNKIQQMLSKCDTCNRCFTNKTSLVKHRVTVHGDRSGFECGACDKSFPTAARLRSHEETHSKASPRGRCNLKKKRYTCKVCQRGFLYRSKLRKHALVHQEEDFPCEDCDATFELRSELEEHARSHERLLLGEELQREENSLACNICDKTFARKCNLARHAAIHKLDDGDRS